MKPNESPAIQAIRAQIQRIAFDANIWDLEIGDYPYAEKCSKKRKLLLAEIDRLQAGTEEMPRTRSISQNRRVLRQTQGQLPLFADTDTSQNAQKP